MAGVGGEDGEIAGPVHVSDDLEGRVLEVNTEWDFVILDLGRNQVEENMEMLIARDDRLVAKVQISKVMGNISIGEVVPEIKVDEIKEDDRVILPQE